MDCVGAYCWGRRVCSCPQSSNKNLGIDFARLHVGKQLGQKRCGLGCGRCQNTLMVTAVKPLATQQSLLVLFCHQEEGQESCREPWKREKQKQMQTLANLHCSSSEVLPRRYQDASKCSKAVG